MLINKLCKLTVDIFWRIIRRHAELRKHSHTSSSVCSLWWMRLLSRGAALANIYLQHAVAYLGFHKRGHVHLYNPLPSTSPSLYPCQNPVPFPAPELYIFLISQKLLNWGHACAFGQVDGAVSGGKPPAGKGVIGLLSCHGSHFWVCITFCKVHHSGIGQNGSGHNGTNKTVRTKCYADKML